jgi:hypothetical protein
VQVVSFSIAIDVVQALLQRATPAWRHQELLVNHASSGNQKIDLAIGLLIGR